VIAFAIVGGFLGKVMAREDTYQHLKPFTMSSASSRRIMLRRSAWNR